MKRKFVLGLGCVAACLTVGGCQTTGLRGTPTANAGNAWNTSSAKSNTPLGKPTPVAQTTWPSGPGNPSFGAPTPTNQTTPAAFRPQAPVGFPPPGSPPGLSAPDTGNFDAPPAFPGAPANSNFAPPGFDPPGQPLPPSQTSNSLHPTPPGLPAPPGSIPDFPAPPPPIMR